MLKYLPKQRSIKTDKSLQMNNPLTVFNSILKFIYVRVVQHFQKIIEIFDNIHFGNVINIYPLRILSQLFASPACYIFFCYLSHFIRIFTYPYVKFPDTLHKQILCFEQHWLFPSVSLHEPVFLQLPMQYCSSLLKLQPSFLYL